jgi:fucose permease
MAREGRQLAVVGALGGLVLFAVSANIVFAALPRMSVTFGVAAEDLATATAVQFTGFFLASIIGGIMADRIGKRRVLLAGAALVAAGAAVWAAAGRLPGVFAGAFVMGLGGGVLESMCTALLADLFPTRRRFVLNLSQVAYCVGAVGGPVLMGWLLPLGVSWRLFFGGTAVGSVLLWFVFLGSRHGAAPAATATAQALPAPRPRLGLSVWVPCLAIFLYVTAETGTATFLTVYLAQAKAAPERWAIVGLALFWGTMMVGRLLCALLPEDHPHERVVAALLTIGALCSVAHLGVADWQGDLWLFALTGLAFAGTWPLIIGLATARHPRQTGTVVGLAAGIGSVGCILAPPLLRPLVASTRPATAFALAGILLVLAAGIILIPCPATDPAEGAPHGDAT